ncbi:von Willebrand factor type A domain protein [[Clostridium] symbiosum WAL-14673]|nr:von Willebrand factor type A domain protein [[Clostridium] symbiosum WAL-14673]
MILTSFQGVAFADLDSTAEDRDILIELDGAALKAEAEAAIRSGELYNAQLGFQELELAESSDGEEKVKLVDSDAYSDIFDQSTGSIYMLKNVPYINKASASDAMHKDAELQVFVKLNGQAAEAASGSSALKASDSNLRKASASDIIVDTQNYEMKGDEKIIFLFINRSEADLTFQLDIDGKKSALILVESKSVLLSEDEKEKEELPPIIPEIPAGGEAIEGGDAAGPGGSSGGGSGSGSGSGITEDNGDNDTTIEDGNQGPEEDSGNTTGDSTPSTGDEGQTGTGEGNNSETENNGGGDSAPAEGETQTKPEDGQDGNGTGGSQNQEGQGNESQTGGQENQGGNGGSAEDNGSSDNGNTDSGNSSESGSGTTDNGSAGNVTTGDSSSDSGSTDSSSAGSGSTDSSSAGSGSTDSGSAGSGSTDSGSEGSSSSDSGSEESGGDVQVSISSHRVDRVMAFVPQDSYDDDDEDAPKSPEEEFEMMYGDDDEEEEADEEQYNGDVEVYSSDTNGVDIPSEVYPVVLVKNKKRALLRMARISAKQADASAGMMITTYGSLNAVSTVDGELNPQVAKRAWKDYTADDEYDVTLEVTGDSIQTTIGGGTADIVFVIDKSSSMNQWDYDLGGNRWTILKETVDRFINKLKITSPNSKISFIEYQSSDLTNYTRTGTYDEIRNVAMANTENADKNLEGYSLKYFRTLQRWTAISEVGSKPYGSAPGGNQGTHSAGGYLGAERALDRLKKYNPEEYNSNVKYVIYLADGTAGFYVDSYGYRDGAGSGGNTNARRAAITQSGELKKKHPDATIYTVAFGSDSSANMNWMKPGAYNGNITNPYNPNVTAFYSATNTEELEKTFDSLAEQVGSSAVTNPKVTDILSGHVMPAGIQINGTTVAAPELYYGTSSITGTSADGVQTAADKGTKLTAVLADADTVNYINSDGKVIAVYSISEKQIDWNVADTLGKDEKRVLTYRVKVTGDYTADYPDEGDNGTGTHSGESGYNSNESAVLTFENGNDVTFPHPVVQVTPSTLTVSKEVSGIDEAAALDADYSFTVRFEDGKQYTAPEGAVWNNRAYNFTLKAGESIEFTGLPTGVKYTVEETGANNVNEDYVLTHIRAEGNGTESRDSTELRPEGLSTTGTIEKSGSTADFVNTYSKYGYITVIKELAGDETAYPDDKEFKFNITPPGGSAGNYDTEIAVTAGDPSGVKLKVEPEDKDKAFTITEADTKGAWRTTAQVGTEAEKNGLSASAKAGETATFKNYYYKREIELTKKLTNSENPSPNAQYKFDVTLKTKNNTALNETDIPLRSDGHELDGFSRLEDGTYFFSVMLKADETVKIVNIPKAVEGFVITEDLAGSTGIDVKYRPEFYSSTLNEVESVGADKVSVTYKEDESRSDAIIITNRLATAEGMLSITKNLVKGSTADSEPVKAKENITFTFKVTNTDTKESFYVSVPVEKGSPNATKVLKVPVGSYVIEEIPYLQYTAVDDTKEASVVPGTELGADAKVEFHNYKSGEGYFTDVKVKVNTVDEGGFPTENNSIPKREALPLAVLFTGSSKAEEDDSNEN